MTELAPPVRERATPGGGVPPSPAARRLREPRWRDTRLVVGVLLVLLAVVLGVRYVSSADRTEAWLGAGRALPAGHVIQADDLTTVRAHLATGTTRRYYRGSAAGSLVGTQLAGPVGRGELLAEGDFVRGAAAAASRVVPVVVHEGRSPELTVGDHVDVYVLSRGAAGTDQPSAGDAEVLVLHDVEFLAARELTSGDRSLLLRVPVDRAIAAVAASQSERVDVVQVAPGGAAAAPGPTSVPGYGT